VTEHKYFVFRFGDIEVTEREFLLVKIGETVPVEPKAFRVLLFLLRNPGRLLTKDEILNAVWNDCSVSDNSLTRSIATLRRLLGDDTREPRYIATVPTVGYRFLCPVDVSEEILSRHASPNLLEAVTGTADEDGGKREVSPDSEFLDSIAVLPFENAGGEADMEYLSEGITTTIINNLSQLNRLRVVPRTTVFRYKGKVSDVAQVGRELRVRVVLTGRVSQRGDALIINVELIDTTHESQLWGANYNGGSEDIFQIQAEIAAQITNKLKLRLNDEEKKQLATRPTESREAYYLLLKSVYWADKWTPEGVRKGVDYARQAIDADPVYAEAWTALSYLFVLIGFFGGAPPIETFAKAKAAAVKALEIDDGKADAHATLSFVRLVYDWDWQGAQVESLRAVELGPNLANGHYVYSHWYLTQGLYEEALREATLALNIDPLSVKFHYQVGAIHFFSRHYDQAIEQLRETNQLDPLFVPAHQLLAAAYARKGMRHNAMAEIEKGSELAQNNLRSKAIWGIVSALAGELVEARKVLDELLQELEPPDFSSAYHCAALHALFGETDEAFACLDMARQGRTVQLAYMAIAPELESLHNDSRFREVLLSIGIPASRT
jgi:TolB-like protein/DNA-binding winged helix-turn-helix (wHTH) protein/Flp pilus assembly protein TadD